MGFGAQTSDYSYSEHLTAFGQAYGNTIEKEVEDLAPVISTKGLNFQYGLWTKKSAFQNPGMTKRKAMTRRKQFKTDYEKVTKTIEPYGGEIGVYRPDGNVYPGPGTLKEIKTMQLYELAYNDRRIALAALLATISNSNARSVAYTAPATAVPLSVDIPLAKRTVWDNCRKVPNTMGIPYEVAEYFVQTAEFIDRFKNWKDTVSKSDLPALISGLKPVVLKAAVDANDLGQSASLGNVYSDTIHVAYIEPNPDPFSLTALSTFRPEWAMDVLMDEYYEEEISTDWITYDLFELIALVCDDAICGITNCI